MLHELNTKFPYLLSIVYSRIEKFVKLMIGWNVEIVASSGWNVDRTQIFFFFFLKYLQGRLISSL